LLIIAFGSMVTLPITLLKRVSNTTGMGDVPDSKHLKGVVRADSSRKMARSTKKSANVSIASEPMIWARGFWRIRMGERRRFLRNSTYCI
jgi:hypothetical protein